MKKSKFIVTILILFIGCIPLISETTNSNESTDTMEPIIVTATRTSIPQSETGSSVSVITAEEIKNQGKHNVVEFLQYVPSVTVSQNSVFGGKSSFYLRGTESGHTLVLIDGVEMNDPISTDRSYNVAHLSADNIEQIEIIRGAQSTLYGSDALGGVINVLTKRGSDKFDIDIFFEAGSYNTFKESLGISGKASKIDYSFMISQLNTDGISKAAAKPNQNTKMDKDSYKNTSFSSRIGVYSLKKFIFNLYLRNTTTEYDMDDGSFQDDPNRMGDTRAWNSKLEITHLIQTWWHHKISYSYMDMKWHDIDAQDEIDTDENDRSSFHGQIQKGESQNNFYIANFDTITVGIEYEQENGEFETKDLSSSTPDITEFKKRIIYNSGYYIQNQLKLAKKFFFTAGLRIDDHEAFGTDVNYKLSSSYLFKKTGTTIKGNTGTGFKAPTLYQLYSSSGNLKLKPEESISYDIGISQSIIKKHIIFDITYFQNYIRNMIEWELLDPDTYKGIYMNKAKVLTQGAESQLSLVPLQTFSMVFGYTYTEAKNLVTGSRLLKRPFHQGSLNLNWRFISKANVNLGMKYVGERVAKDYSTGDRLSLNEYSKIDIAVSYQIIKYTKLHARVENLMDTDYETVYGYNMPGRAYYGGISAHF